MASSPAQKTSDPDIAATRVFAAIFFSFSFLLHPGEKVVFLFDDAEEKKYAFATHTLSTKIEHYTIT
jgi:hypothetical protein